MHLELISSGVSGTGTVIRWQPLWLHILISSVMHVSVAGAACHIHLDRVPRMPSLVLLELIDVN